MRRETARRPPDPISKRLAVALAIGLLAIASFNIYTLPLYPSPSCDEVSSSSIATSFLEQGEFGWAVFTQGDYLGRDVNLFRHGRLYEAGLITLFGTLGVSWLAGRAYSLFGGAAAVLLVYLIGSRLYNRRTGALAALAFVTSVTFFLTSHLTRPDIWLAVWNLVTLAAVYKAIHAPASRWALLAGLAAVASFDIHGHGVTIIFAAITVVLWDIGWQKRDLHRVAIFIGGLAIGSIVWVLIHLWPAPEIAFAQLSEPLSYTSLPKDASAASSNFLQNALTSGQFLFDVYWGNSRWLGLLEGLLTIAGLVVAFIRRNQADRLLVIWVGVSFATFALLFSQRFVNYYVLWSPLLILLGLSAIDFIAARLPGAFQQTIILRHASLVVGLALAATNLAGTIWLTYRYRDNNFLALSQAVQTAVPKGVRVLADPNWWWSLRTDRTFITDEYFLYPLPPFTPPSPSVTAAIDYLKPDYILLDSATSCADLNGPGHAELQTYAKSSCTLIGTLDGVWRNDPSRATTLLGQTTSIYRCTLP